MSVGVTTDQKQTNNLFYHSNHAYFQPKSVLCWGWRFRAPPEANDQHHRMIILKKCHRQELQRRKLSNKIKLSNQSFLVLSEM
jgi:hypothetical protein